MSNVPPNKSMYHAVLACCVLTLAAGGSGAASEQRFEQFEKRIRPLLAEHCWKCHGPEKQEAGLRLDSAAGVQQGGDSGVAVLPGRPEQSLLLQAVLHTNDLQMPPTGKLPSRQIEDLRAWIADGAAWPEPAGTHPTRKQSLPLRVLEPNAAELAAALQLWLAADSLHYDDKQPVPIWPDKSGRGRDFSATRHVRSSGVGTAPTFAVGSKLNGRPAVRFETGNGMASSPDLDVAIHGDAAATIFVVCQLTPGQVAPKYDNLLMIGNASVRSAALYLEIDRATDEHSFDFAGGWGQDAVLGPGSARLFYNEPRIVSITKAPGPRTATTRIYLEGRPAADVTHRAITGSAEPPNVQHSAECGVAIGKALPWMGNLRGDLGEVIIYNRALSDAERRGVEAYLQSKYDLLTPEMLAEANREFTPAEQAHWAFQPIRDPQPPINVAAGWASSEIDRFVLAKLEAQGLRPAPVADRRTLIRRLTLDLVGLPPQADEISQFVNDPRDDEVAVQDLIERLLASPHYGERWGRHWLDVVRYADTTANDGNFVMRYAYRYRDYVVDAFNRDKPWREFLVEQLAGDLLPPSPDPLLNSQRVIATGFLMVGPKALAETDKEQVKMDIVDEQLDVMGRAMLGLTVACARCHDHKFDPIPTVDYYSLAGIFRSTEVFSDLVRNASKWMEYQVPAGSNGEMLEVMAPKDGAVRNLRVHLRGSRFQLGQVAPRRFLQVLAGTGHPPLPSSSSGRLELAHWITSADQPLTARVIVNRIWQGHFGVGLVSTSDNFGTRGQPPTHPELLDWLATRFRESGWSVKAMHRLILSSQTYRMSAHTTPELKQHGLSVDPENRLYWRARRRRLDAEQVRDSLLSLSGELDARLGGGELVARLFETSDIIDKTRGVASAATINSSWEGFDSPRRSIYLPVVRNGVPDLLALFDAADPNNVTTVRNETTVSSQAAFMLNNPFVLRQAGGLARRIILSQEDQLGRVREAYLRVLGREPAAVEEAVGRAYLSESRELLLEDGKKPEELEHAAWSSYCQLLFCANEFLYVE